MSLFIELHAIKFHDNDPHLEGQLGSGPKTKGHIFNFEIILIPIRCDKSVLSKCDELEVLQTDRQNLPFISIVTWIIASGFEVHKILEKPRYIIGVCKLNHKRNLLKEVCR